MYFYENFALMTATDRNPLILLPYNFSALSNQAAQHALQLAKFFGYRLKLFNRYDKVTCEYLRTAKLSREDLGSQLEEVASRLRTEHNVEVDYCIRKGSLKVLNTVAEDLKVAFSVFGLGQGVNRRPMFKVLRKSPVPVYIVHEGLPEPSFTNLLFPLDDFPGSRQKVGLAARLAQATKAKIHVFSVNKTSKDDTYEHLKIVDQVEDFFAKRNLEVVSEVSEAGMNDFAGELLHYGRKANCDCLVMILRPSGSFRPVHPRDRQLIFNDENIPVFCINLRDVGITGGFS